MNTNENKVRGSHVSREDYWEAVRQNLLSLEPLRNLLAQSHSNLIVSVNGYSLRYETPTGKSMTLVLNEQDTRSASFTILAEGSYEGFLETLILKLAGGSSTFLDIGANAGFYSVGSALTNTNLKIHAFEPNPNVARDLRDNVSKNLVSENVQIHNFGLSDSEGKAEFFVPAFTGTGGGSLRDLHPEEGRLENLVVDLKTLDSLGIEGVDLVKLDVEGNELSTIQGGLGLFQSSKPTLVVELLRKWMSPFGHKPQDVIQLLVPLGYKCLAVGSHELTRIEQIDDQTSETNFVFLHEDREDHLRIIENMTGSTIN